MRSGNSDELLRKANTAGPQTTFQSSEDLDFKEDIWEIPVFKKRERKRINYELSFLSAGYSLTYLDGLSSVRGSMSSWRKVFLVITI
jgi:hypothetical protein